jgi:hypothetical protein
MDLVCCTCHHRGRWSRAVEEGGTAVSYDEEGRRAVAWQAALWRKEEVVIEEERSAAVSTLTRHRASCCRYH